MASVGVCRRTGASSRSDPKGSRVFVDIAGPARAESSYDEANPGGTGFATRTLIEFAYSFTG